MTKQHFKRLRYLFPVLLAALSLAVGVTLTGSLERSRDTTQRTAEALITIEEAAELVWELRFGSFENLAVRGNDLAESWRRLEPRIVSLSRQRAYGSQELPSQILRTSALFESARKISSPAVAQEIAVKGLVVWAGWRRLERSLTQRLTVELAGPGNQAAILNLLAALGCLSCALLLWQTWRAGQIRDDAGMVENRLRESESRTRTMIECARETLIQADASGRILRSNHKLTAVDMASLFDSPETWTRTVDKVRSAPAGSTISPCQVWVSADKEGRLMDWRVAPVRDASGGLVRIDSAMLDVTHWHVALQNAQTRVAELEQIERRLELQLKELLAQSNELAESRSAIKRTADARMEALQGWGRRVARRLGEAASLAESVGSGPLDPADSSALVGAVETVAASLQALAEFAGLERGQLELSPSAVCPHEQLEECLEAVAGRAEVKHVELPCFVQQGIPLSLVTDSRRLHEVLVHVLEHAIANTSCGEVAVRLNIASRSATGVNLRFEVEDTGSGFSRDELAALFEPFHPGLAIREVASRLAFAKRIVEKMGGQFGAESEPGQGTRVWFVIPCQTAAAGEAGKPDEALSELAGKRILIVHESASQRGALLELCQILGLYATPCSSAEEALPTLTEAASQCLPFEFVLINYEMPGTGGPELAMRVVNEPALAASAVSLIVPFSLRALTEEPGPLGLRGAIASPIRRRAMADLLRRVSTDGPAPAWASVRAADPFTDVAVQRQRADVAPAGSPIVLVVEDNLVNQRVAVRLVEKMGYRAAVVNNGLEAIHAFRRENYDLILMDCQMPELDGFTATAEIRRLETPGSHLPIIAMTANAMRGDREKCLAAGMDDYISKPVAFEDLRVLITRWLARVGVARH